MQFSVMLFWIYMMLIVMVCLGPIVLTHLIFFYEITYPFLNFNGATVEV